MIELARFPIVDAHHHVWDLTLGKHPWLCREPWIHMRYGDYSAIRGDYLPRDYLRDAAGFDVAKTIYVEAEWDPRDPTGEVRWVKDLMERAGLPHAVVAQAWLDADDAESVLARHAESGIVRSVRHKPTVTHSPHVGGDGPRGSMSDDRWRRGFGLLERYGLAFDLQVVHWHLPEAARLARDFPRTTIIVNHAGLPSDRSPAGLAVWRAALETIAREPNCALKISGLGSPSAAWTVEHNRDVVLACIEVFGVERCMFASNFPVDRLGGSYRAIMGGFMEIVAHLPLADQRRLFHDNAQRYYRL